MTTSTKTSTTDAPLTAPVPMTPMQEFWHYFSSNKGAVAGLVVIAIICFMAVFANFVAPHSPSDQYRDALLLPPAWLEGGNWSFVLGTDDVGRDILSRLIYGSRLSIAVGIVAVTASLVMGILLSGAILTETVFAWPGIGKWLIESIGRRDYPVVQGGILIVACIIIVVNLLVDITYGIVNPRIRHSR